MATHFLCLNDDKTEVILFGSKNNTSKIGQVSLTICEQTIVSSESVRNLGLLMDCNMNLQSHVDNVRKGAWFCLRKIGQIRKYLNRETTEKLVHAYVSSKLDSINAVLYGLPATKLDKLKRVQHAAVRMVTQTRKLTISLPLCKTCIGFP